MSEADRNAMRALPPEPDLPSLPVRVVQVFTSPARLFDALRVTPRALGALLVVIGLGLVVQALIPAELVREAAMAALPADAPPEQVAAVERFVASLTMIRWAATVVAPMVFILVAAAFVLLVWNVMMGGEERFRTVLACSSHAFIIWAVGGIVTLPLMLARRDPRTAFALHVLVPGLDPGTYLFRLLHGLNVFALWTMVVLGIAVSRLYPKARAGSAATVLVLAFALWVAFLAILSPG